MREADNFTISSIINGKFIIFLLITSLLLSGCLNLLPYSVISPSSTKTMIITDNGKPDIKKMVYVDMQIRKLTPINEAELRNEYLPSALKDAGISKYKILSPGQEISNSNEVKDSYLIVLSITNWDVSMRSGAGACSDLFVYATMTVFELPDKKELITVSGQSSDFKCDTWSIKELISYLSTKMLNKAYKG